MHMHKYGSHTVYIHMCVFYYKDASKDAYAHIILQHTHTYIYIFITHIFVYIIDAIYILHYMSDTR